jgi:hypothetical protein
MDGVIVMAPEVMTREQGDLNASKVFASPVVHFTGGLGGYAGGF